MRREPFLVSELLSSRYIPSNPKEISKSYEISLPVIQTSHQIPWHPMRHPMKYIKYVTFGKSTVGPWNQRFLDIFEW